MKLMNVTEKQIGDFIFYIKPFPAFVSAGISGDLAAFLAPVIGGFAPLLGNDNNEVDIENTDVEKVLPVMSSAFSSLSGDNVTKLMKELLIDHRNIAFEDATASSKPQTLTMDLANEIFCEELQDMYLLCWEVIKINFGGFFKKLSTQFGNLSGVVTGLTSNSKNTGSLTAVNSAN